MTTIDQNYLKIINNSNLLNIQKYYNENFSRINELTNQLAFIKAIDNNEKKISKWLIKNVKETKKAIQNAFIICCEKGNIKLAEWLNNFKKEIDLHCASKAFKLACLGNQLEIAKWIYKNFDIKSENFNNVFLLCCENNYLEIVKYIYSIQQYINFSKKNEYIICTACFKGNYDLVKWILNIKPNININYDNDYCFRASCQNNHLEVVKLIYNHKKNINNDIINIELKNACFTGNYDLTVYLLEILPIINITYFDDEIVFKYACENSLIDLANVFTKFFGEKYSFKIIKNKIVLWWIYDNEYYLDQKELKIMEVKVEPEVKINNENIENIHNIQPVCCSKYDNKTEICNVCKINNKFCQIKNWPYIMQII